MRLVNHPESLDSLPPPKPQALWRVLISGCMAGWACGIDATDYGMGGATAHLMDPPNVQVVPCCPEGD